ncbi:MAG: hypothetical protein IT393_07465 [Nitrospirae bacterium]|nr:hypothetical protein [Nitrospirota bacterium]
MSYQVNQGKMGLIKRLRYFKVEGDNGSLYIIRHDMTSLEWELTLFEEKG